MRTPNRANLLVLHPAFASALAATLLCAALAGCEAPPVAPGLDSFVCPADGGDCVLPPANGEISGSVAYSGPRRGDVILLLFAAGNLPPPDGTATTAVSLSRVPAARLFTSASPLGPFGAPFTFTNVKPGNYQIRAFLDVTGDFDPFADFTLSPRAGAPTGGSVVFDAGGPRLTSFNVPANTTVNVTVALGQEAPYDPPAFRLSDTSVTSFANNYDRSQVLVLEAFNPNVPRATFANPKFGVELARDGAGLPHVSFGDGLADVYPQVLLKQIESAQADGSFAAVADVDAAIIPCEVQSTPLLPLLLALAPGQPPIAVDQLTVLVQPLAVKLGAGGSKIPQPSVPPGRYQVVVIEKSGQVWTLPNSLGTQDPGSKYFVSSQGQRITIGAAVAPGGSISGKVHYPANRKFGNLVLQAYRGGPQFAPPLAALPPTRVKLIPGQFIAPVDTTVPFTVDYTIDALPPGQYVVEALDDGDGNFNALNLLQTPTKGDLIGGVIDPATARLQVIDVQGAVAGKGVTLDLAANLATLDPPAFELDESAGPAQIAQDARGVVRLSVKARPPAFPIWSAAQGAFTGAGSPLTTFFTVGLVRDAAGNPVDSDSDGLPDVWPRALLVKLSDADPTNLRQDTPTTVIPVAVDPTPFLPALLSGAKDLVLPAAKLSLIVRPAALDASDPSAPKRLPVMPAGKYKLVLLNKTGQVWQLPNEAGPAALDPRVGTCTTSCQPGQVASAAQGRFFSVVSPAVLPLPSGEIDGVLTIAGATTSTSVALFAWHAEDPPPPLGTSASPASADLHLGAELVAGPAAGTKTVAFALRALPKGDYYVTAVVDTRGDFALAPQLWGAAPGPGALAGGVLNAQHTQLMRVTVDAAAVPGVSALASASAPLPARPSFAISQSGSPVVADLTTLFPDALSPQRITLHAGGKTDAQSVWGPVLDATTAALKPESGQSQFAIAYRGCSNGAPVDSDFDNLPDVWPRVLVVKLSDADPSGLTPDPVTTLIPAAVDPLRYLPSSGAAATLPLACDTTTAVAASEVDVILSPVAIQPQPSGALKQIPIPAGRYGIVLIAQSGQVWRLPNELAPALLDPRAAGSPAGQQLLPQGVSIRIAAQVPGPLGGAIAGAVKLPDYGAADVGNLVVLAYLASAPPPPAGLGRPVAVQLIPKPVVAGAAGSAQPFLLANLPAGDYFVAALLDPLGQLSTSFGFMSTPPKGAQLAFSTGGGAAPAKVSVSSSLVVLPDASAITLDKLVMANVLPFDRPAFAVDTTSSTLSLSAATAPGTPAVLRLLPTVPAGVPYALPSTPAFHPVVFRDPSTGSPVREASANPACPGGAFRSTQVYASPIDTGQRYVAAVRVDSCQFCQSLTGVADCSAAPLAPPSGPLPFAGPLVAAVLNLAIDPLTKAPAGVPLPIGHYAITVVEQSGLVWTVPNDLREVGGTSGALQGFAFTVTP